MRPHLETRLRSTPVAALTSASRTSNRLNLDGGRLRLQSKVRHCKNKVASLFYSQSKRHLLCHAMYTPGMIKILFNIKYSSLILFICWLEEHDFRFVRFLLNFLCRCFSQQPFSCYLVFRHVGAYRTQKESAKWETIGRCQNRGLHSHHGPDCSKYSLSSSFNDSSKDCSVTAFINQNLGQF